jgi:hypothetical protein
MAKIKVDLVVQIEHDINDPSKSVIRTNAKPEVVEEILEAWLQDQVGRGRDDVPPAIRDVYTIKIGLVLMDDSFCTESDAGNAGLTTGIVMTTLADCKSIPILSLGLDPDALVV